MKRLKGGFTLLEMVLVIVVLGILAAMAIPRLDRDIRQNAADTILGAIRYTQYLALHDNKTNPRDGSWQKRLWHIRFSSYDSGSGWFFTISSNADGDTNVNKDETAIDPATGKYYYHLAGDATLDETDESKSIFITHNFGINDVDFSGCDVLTGSGGTSGGNDVQHIAFDHLGRPHRGIYGAQNDNATLMHEDCLIVFKFEDPSYDDLQIRIEAQTGRAQIVGQPYS